MLNSKNQDRIEVDTNASWIQASALGYLVLIVFISWKALEERGYLGILGLAFSTWAGSQVFLDLVIALWSMFGNGLLAKIAVDHYVSGISLGTILGQLHIGEKIGGITSALRRLASIAESAYDKIIFLGAISCITCYNFVMYRNQIEKLRTWHSSTRRKPLILRGARQVGKSTLVRQFAKENKLRLIGVYALVDEYSPAKTNAVIVDLTE